MMFSGHRTHTGGSEVAVGRNWVWGVPMPSADEPALAAMINGQPGGLGLGDSLLEEGGQWGSP